ncbi:MAG: isocitrate lyase/phosphoenolpyruvate mutase family protein [Phycisphaerales bacterium]|nr:isocitrate lyase/phosphoenolpyruvate mutase family protein [Phycisphaerales bacterium]
MIQSIQIFQAQSFRQLHDRSNVLLLPNAWDAASAKVLENLNFAAIATTSGGVAWSMGYADGEKIPWEEMLAAIGRITRAVKIPVTADIEGGFGQTTEDVARHVGQVIQVGAVGINLEDTMPATGQLRDPVDAANRIDAARQAASKSGVSIVINARVDTYARQFGSSDAERFAETIRRAQSYLAAGADCIFPIGLHDGQILRQLAARLDAPINVAAHPDLPPLNELKQMGIARVSTATRLAILALEALQHSALELRDTGRFGHLQTTLAHSDLQKLMKTP